MALLLFLFSCTHIEPNKAAENSLKTIVAMLDESQLTEHLKVLSSDDFSGRKLGSQGNEKSRRYIINVLKNDHVNTFAPDYRHKFVHHSWQSTTIGQNIIAVVEGTKFSEKYIVLTAHFDHLGIKGGKIYNGADDNASGTATLLSLAKQIAIKPLRYSVIFLFTDGEEVNLLGAKSFVNDYAELIPKIKLNINLDMIAGNQQTKTLHYISKNIDSLLNEGEIQSLKNFFHHNKLKIKQGFNSVNKRSGKNLGRNGWIRASDHGVFHRKKIPFIYFGVGTHQNYHTHQDTFERVNLAFYLSASQLIYQQIRFIDLYM